MNLLLFLFLVRIPELVLRIVENCKSLIIFWVAMRLFKRRCSQKVDSIEEEESHELGLLDLPDLVLENIFSRLCPSSLIRMGGVCRDLRKMCTSDHIWDVHIKTKWSRVAGLEARRGWQWIVAMNEEVVCDTAQKCRTRQPAWSCLWPFSCCSTRQNFFSQRNVSTPTLRHDSMSWYIALESGSFWFPAQVYNREHGHIGFVLSCYDAYLCYEHGSNTFKARYPPHGPHNVVVEEGIHWERIRSAPVDTPAQKLYFSNCLDNLHPGDHVEVQWRKNKDFPYGWWYGVVGHSDACYGYGHQCQCHLDDILWLEFNQYSQGSQWRRAPIKRRCHREAGSEAEGFYGGVRKLKTLEEISTWKQMWPAEILD
eukprot:TRINITY_DN3125_c0_g1_i1.p1 TRINITY_DN3125_c0_g1~~TRINITY_DN3125_c0_g1_i1.p1  ORF type:complete len:368 (-),score=52.10 TRINITY_DN3125_c0_g1_i1:229-1332(-)